MIYALDTNIISYLLKDDGRVYSRYFDAVSQGNTCVIPLVVYYEVLRGLKASGATTKMRAFEKICGELGVVELTVKDINTAADIYTYCKQRGTPVDDSDLLIASQVVTRGYTLVTNNTRHFAVIDGLTFVNWAE